MVERIMLFDLPNDDALYDALIARSSDYEGLAYVCVKTTGIFCRLTCPARKPKRENTLFYDCIATCMQSGFRPCRRCRPLEQPGREPVIDELLGTHSTVIRRRGGRRTIWSAKARPLDRCAAPSSDRSA